MGQQCGCLPDSAPLKFMHGTRVSAGEEKGHATALFLAHKIPGIGIGGCRVALPSRATAGAVKGEAYRLRSYSVGAGSEDAGALDEQIQGIPGQKERCIV